MALEIKESKGILELLGRLTSQNLGAVQVYFEHLLETNEHLLISLENVEYMDASSALFFEELYKKSAERGIALTIIGRENKNIEQIMRKTKTDYILSMDRI